MLGSVFLTYRKLRKIARVRNGFKAKEIMAEVRADSVRFLSFLWHEQRKET